MGMKEDETIIDFNVWFRDIANKSFALSENDYEEKMATKILRSLLKRFNMKVTTIEEAWNIFTIKVDELIELLLDF